MTISRVSQGACLVLATLLSGCVSHLSPAVFQVPAGRGTMDSVQRALAQQGTSIARIDPNAGVAETAWESTGQNTDGTIWATRYIVTVSPQNPDSRITVMLDLRTCDGLGVNSMSGTLDATPCRRVEDAIPTMYQNRLNEFATRLQSAL